MIPIKGLRGNHKRPTNRRVFCFDILILEFEFVVALNGIDQFAMQLRVHQRELEFP